MRALVALWEDVYKQVFNTEIFTENTSPLNYGEQAIQAKSLFGHNVTSQNINPHISRISFTDGTQVTFFLKPVQTLNQPTIDCETTNERIRISSTPGREL